MIIHYIVEENIFVVIAYMLWLQKKYYIVTLEIALKLVVSKQLECLRKVNLFNSKILKEK